MNDHVKTHQVAIVVFCEADGVDYLDAASVADMALKKAIGGPERNFKLDGSWTREGERHERTVNVVCFREAGIAIRNGYFRVEPSNEAFKLLRYRTMGEQD